MTLGLGFYEGDALSRSANAMNVVLGRDPHVAAIGFVWNPLPSLVQIPLVLLLDRFNLIALAGPFSTAAFSASTLWILDRTFRLLGVPTTARWALLVLYAFNPFVFFYSANGLSEAPFVLFLLAATYEFLRWTRGQGLMPLILFAGYAALAFLVRYEGVAFAGSAVLALALVSLSAARLEPDRLEAILLTFLAPVTYVVGLWIFFNWLFMGDPLYFQRSSYGNLAQTQNFRSGDTYLTGVVGDPMGALQYGLFRWTLLFPLALPIALAALGRALLRRDGALLGLLLLAGSVPVFHVYLAFSGTSFGWLRFFMYSIPFTFVILAYVMQRGTRGQVPGRLRGPAWAVLLAMVALSTPASLFAMSQPDVGREEWAIMGRFLDASAPVPPSFQFSTEREIATWVDAQPAGTVVLMDSFLGFPANVFSRNHDRFAITSDRDFPEVLKQPRGLVTHILVPNPGCPPNVACLAQADQVSAAFPTLWASGADWATLERDFGGLNGWRLYRVQPLEAR